VVRRQAKAVRAAFLITHDETLAEDVVQDTFVRIYHRINHFDPSRPFEPYLLRSVVNAALNVAQKGRHRSMEGDFDQVEGLLSQATSVESDVEYIQLKQRIVAALAELEPRQRAVVIQRYYLEMSESIAHFDRVTLIMEEDIALDPVKIGFLCPIGIMFQAQLLANLV
jgi:RNA polymerase sigma-70 factor, ECF subfamily